MSENVTISYLNELCAQLSQIVFLAELTVLRLITTVWERMKQNSYLREFSVQVSQIVLFADFTVLRLITTVWVKVSQNSYLNEFYAQVSQNVFLADLTVFRPNASLWAKMSEKFISPRVLCTSITNRVLNWSDRFTTYYYCMSKKLHKTFISTSSVHKYPKSCS